MWKIFITMSCFSAAVLAAIFDSRDVPGFGFQTSDTSVQCPKGFYKDESDCYHLSEKRANWDQADIACRTMNSSLVVPPDKDRARYLETFLKSPKFDDLQRWVGVRYNPTSKIWVSGRTGEKIPYYHFWKKNFKRDLSWKCAIAIPKKNYQWAPRKCSLRRHYICHISLDPPREVVAFEPSVLPLTSTVTVIRDPSKPQDTTPPKKKFDRRIRDPTKPQADKPDPLKTNEISKRSTVESDEIPQLNYRHSDSRHARKSVLRRTRWAPGTKSSDRLRLIRSKNPNESDQWVPRRAAIAPQNEKENREKPFTENYRTSSRTLVAESNDGIFELNRHPNVDLFNAEVLLKTYNGKGVSNSR